MQPYGRKKIAPQTLLPQGPGGQRVKIKLFQNIVMLHIKLKRITGAATCNMVANIMPADPPPPPPPPDPGGQKVKIQLFQNMVILHIKLKDNLFKNTFDFTTAGDWGYVAVVERLPVLQYSVDFIFLSFGIMCFIVELKKLLEGHQLKMTKLE